MTSEIIGFKFPQLETENLKLRAVTLADAEVIFKIFADQDVIKYHDLERPRSIAQVKSLINRWSERFLNGEGVRWGIARKQDNIIIGSCGYSYKSFFSAEIGYELAKAYWRQGIMTEALSSVIKFGFQTMELNRIQAMVMLENTASLKLLQKLGFLEEGILREYGYWKDKFHDLRILSLLKKDYL